MAISNTTVRQIYNGDASTTDFAIPFAITTNANTEVQVYIINETTGIATLKTLTTHYTLINVVDGFPTQVRMNSAPTADEQVLLIRATTYTQTMDADESGNTPLEDIELALDKLTAITQELKEKSARSLKFKINSTNTDVEFPEAEDGFYIKWDGTDLVNVELVLDDIAPATTKGDLLVRTATQIERKGVGTNGYILVADSGDPTGVSWQAQSATVNLPLSTIGDLLSSDGATNQALSVGSDGQYLIADSGQALGLRWATLRTQLGLTSKGQILVDDSSSMQALNVGANNTVLTADSAAANGIKWATLRATLGTTTKGDILVDTGAALTRLPVGTNDQILTADSAQASGVKWADATSGSVSPLTTKGDLYTYDSGNQRFPVGTDGQILYADSGETTGLLWDDPPVGFTTPLTTKGDVHTWDSADQRLAVGSNGTILTANSAQSTGLQWTTIRSRLGISNKGDLVTDTGAALSVFAVGADNTILTAASGQTSGLQWTTIRARLPLTTKGDLLVDTGSALAALAVGANNKVLVADSTATNGVAWKSYQNSMRQNQTTEMSLLSFTHFMNTTTGAIFTQSVGNSGTSAALTDTSGFSDHPGVWELSTGAVSNQGRSSIHAGGNQIRFGGTSTYVYETYIYIPTLATDGVEDYKIWIGFHNGTTAEPTRGIGFEYDVGNSTSWKGFVAGGAMSRIDLGAQTVNAATWTKLKVEVIQTGSIAKFYIGDSLVATSTLDANYPDNTDYGMPCMTIIKNTGTGARTLNLDYYIAWQEF